MRAPKPLILRLFDRSNRTRHTRHRICNQFPTLLRVQVSQGDSLVDRTVGEHIRVLEERLSMLNDQIMDENDTAKRNRLDAELRAVQSALTLYRSALEIENRVFAQDS